MQSFLIYKFDLIQNNPTLFQSVFFELTHRKIIFLKSRMIFWGNRSNKNQSISHVCFENKTRSFEKFIFWYFIPYIHPFSVSPKLPCIRRLFSHVSTLHSNILFTTKFYHFHCVIPHIIHFWCLYHSACELNRIPVSIVPQKTKNFVWKNRRHTTIFLSTDGYCLYSLQLLL